MNVVEQQSATAISLKNILFATDFSAASESALPYALAISRRYGSVLHAAHVLSEGQMLMMSGSLDGAGYESVLEGALLAAEARMHELTARFDDLPYKTYVGYGQIWDSLSGLIRSSAIDLLVVGTHGRTGVGKLLMGSVAEQIFRQTPCPVLTVGPKVSGHARLPLVSGGESHELAPAELELREIVFATDFSRESLSALPYAISLAREFQARLALLHVIEVYPRQEKGSDPVEAALQRLSGLVPEDAGLWFQPEPVIGFDSPAEAILKTAAQRNADLIILGVRPPRGHLTAATHLPWRTAHKVVAEARCPVLTIRGSIPASST